MVRFLIRAFFFLALLSLGLRASSFAIQVFIEPVTLKAPTHLKLDRGEGASLMAKKAYQQGLVRSPKIFLIYAFMLGIDHSLKPGEYQFDPGVVSLKMLFDKLLQGFRKQGKSVILVPGLTLKEVAAKLAEEGIIKSTEEFLALANDFPLTGLHPALSGQRGSLEGFLYPDTYEFAEGIGAKGALQKILDRFSEIVTPTLAPLPSGEEILRTLKLASIVEMESGSGEEKGRIAGVFANRLRLDMLLQTDATIQYALEKRTERVLFKDLEVESPYNSYKYKGLPPTPICSPRLPSILAALNPESHDFLYFVATGKGGHVFAKNLSDHERNKRAYLKAMGWQ